MANRSIMVRLGLNAQDFNAGIRSATSSLDQMLQKAGKSEQLASTGMGRMLQSIQHQGQEWQTVGGHLAKVGAAQGAVAAAVAVTGGNYNRLQQTSRAALTTMLGGAREANAQMDKLDAWASTSPFSRAVWIEAQQQLLAFGVEANRVVPYMEGIQNAVAAAGGSETHLRGITEIMAKISSSSKITGQDLMAFGNWGVNAADLIGLAMGKTGAQIREEITAGTLDAQVALDALAIGMNTRFEGAATNVKNTFDGAFDRVKAAFRDVSAELMQPFIGQEGGGIFTAMLNQAADLMRAFQKLPTPVKDFAGGLGVASTAMTLFGAAFLTVVPRMVELQTALGALGSAGIPIISRLAASFASVGPSMAASLTALTGGFRQMRAEMEMASVLGVSKMQGLRVGVGAAMTGMRASAKAAGSALLGAFGGPVGLAVTATIAGITAAVMNYSRKQQEANAFAKQFAGTLDEVTGAATQATQKLVLEEMFDRAGAAAWQASGQMEAFADAVLNDNLPAMQRIAAELDRTAQGTFVWSEAARVAGDAAHFVRAYELSMENAAATSSVLGDATDEMRSSVEGAAGGMDGLADSADNAAAAQERYLDILKGVIDFERQRADNYASLEAAQDKQLETLAELNSQLEENGQTLDQNTEAGRKNRAYLRDLQDGYHSVIDSMIAMTDEQGNATYSAQQMGTETQRMRDEFIETAMQFGVNAEEAAAMADAYGLVPDQVETRAEFDNATAKAELRATLDEYTEIPAEIRTLLTAFGDDALAVAAVVAEAIEVGVPAEKLTEILADGSDAVTTSQEVQSAIDSVKQKNAATIKALNEANPEVVAAQRSIDSVKQSSPADIRATDNASPTLTHVRNLLSGIQSKTITVTAHHVVTGSLAAGTGMVASRAHGGAVFGAGTTTSDSIPAWLSHSEHVWSAREVHGAGGHAAVEAMRALARIGKLKPFAFAGGGTPAYAAAPASSITVRSEQTPVVFPDHVRISGRLEQDPSGQEAFIEAKIVEWIPRG